MTLIAKKIIALAIAGLVLIVVVPLNANAATQNDLSFEVTDGQATIVKCDQNAAGELIIPDTLGGYPVTSIGNEAFQYCTALKNIIIPDSVKSIGDEAFDSCEGLTSITIPNSVKRIGNDSFTLCSALNTVGISESVKSIGYGAFGFCESLISINVNKANTVYASENGVLFNHSKKELICYPGGKAGAYTIPNGVIIIDEMAFACCLGLTSIIIPNSVSSIGEQAFNSCYRLKNIIIPDSVSSIGYRAFFGTPWYSNQPEGLIYAGKVAYYYKGYIPDNTTVVLKSGTKGIAGGAFEPQYEHTDNPGLIDIYIPNTVTDIGENAFYYCTGLKNISIPKSVASIGKKAFLGCTGLKSVTVPNSVASIGEYALGYYIFDEDPEIFPGFTINCFANSAGLKYAKENGFAYNILPASAATTDPTAATTDPTTITTGPTENMSSTETTINLTVPASTDESSGISNRVTITAIIVASIVFLAAAAIAVFITVKRKKKK